MISIIIPVYNAATTIERCAESILNQTFRDWELILINDGSTDDSCYVCDAIMKKDKRVRVISQENRGVSAARNRGIQSALGEYISFVDADDYLDNQMIEKLWERCLQDHADLVMCGYKQIIGDVCRLEREVEFSIRNIQDLSGHFAELYQKGLLNTPCGKLYRKSCVTNLFEEGISLGEDLLFNLAFLKNCAQITGIRGVYYNYSISLSGTLHTRIPENAEELYFQLYNETMNFCQDILNTSEYEGLIAGRLVVNLYSLLYSFTEGLNYRDYKNRVTIILGKSEIKDAIAHATNIKLRYFISTKLILNNSIRGIFLYFTWIKVIKKFMRR